MKQNFFYSSISEIKRYVLTANNTFPLIKERKTNTLH